MTTRKTSELATLARAHKPKAATHNAAAAKALEPQLTRNGKPKQKLNRERVMVNCPPELKTLAEDAAQALDISLSTFFIFAVREKLARDSQPSHAPQMP